MVLKVEGSNPSTHPEDLPHKMRHFLIQRNCSAPDLVQTGKMLAFFSVWSEDGTEEQTAKT